MKTLILTIIGLVFCLPVYPVGGDMIGGSMRNTQQALRLSKRQKDELKRMRKVKQMYQAWKRELSRNNEEQVLKFVFEKIVYPQLNGANFVQETESSFGLEGSCFMGNSKTDIDLNVDQSEMTDLQQIEGVD